MLDAEAKMALHGYLAALEERTGFLVFSVRHRDMRASIGPRPPELAEGEVSFAQHAYPFTRKDVSDVVEMLGVENISFGREPFPCREAFPRPGKPYAQRIRGFHSGYVRKDIYLLKRTMGAIFLAELEKRQYLVLARPSRKSLSIELYRERHGDAECVVALSDSDELGRLERKRQRDIIGRYRPLLMRAADIRRYMDGADGICINPADEGVLGKDLVLYVPKDAWCTGLAGKGGA